MWYPTQCCAWQPRHGVLWGQRALQRAALLPALQALPFLLLGCSVGTAHHLWVTQYLWKHQVTPEAWLVGANIAWTRSLGISKEGPTRLTLLKAKWYQSGASRAPCPHLFNSKDVEALLYMCCCSSFRFNLSYMALHLERLPLSMI